MSERPATDAGIISELYGFAWSDEYDLADVEQAINNVIDDEPELAEFCQWVRRSHNDTADPAFDGRRSWRDFRNVVVKDRFQCRFDADEIGEKIEEEVIREVDGGDPDV